MVSPVTFPYTQPNESSITKDNALKPLRPPPLNLKTGKKFQLPKIKAVRGSVSGADEGTEVPLMIEMSTHRLAASDALGGKSYEWIDMDVSKSRPWEGDMDRPVSPPRSLRTIIDLDSPLGSEDESDISPISDERPADHSSKVLARFFPELQSNFAVMAPEGLDTTPKPRTGRSRVENEIQARVKSLYHNSGDNLGQVLGSNTPSDVNFLNRLEWSDYSRQTSMASFGTDVAFQRTNKYRMTTDSSNYSPVQAGVFDETASVRPRASKRMSGARPAPTRLNSTTSKSSSSNLRDMRNKPLPLAPLVEPISTDPHHDHQRPSAPHRYSSPQCTDCTPQHHNVPHSAYASRNRQPHRCQTCGHWDNRHRRGSPNSSEYRLNSRNHQRHVSTWQQAADEMEINLSLDGMKRRLVLEGPLQISRNNGDLVAARPAPLPPSQKPYSGSNQNTPKKETRTGSVSSRQDNSEPRKKGHKYNRSKDSTDSSKAKTAKAKDEPKSRWGGNSKFNESTKGDLLKLKKSFSISRATFTRKQNPTRSDQHRLSTLSSRSETSVDPQADHANLTDKTRLSMHLSQSDPNLEKIPDEIYNRDDLLLQLPRLQTDNFGFKTLLDQFAPDTQTAAGNPANSKSLSLHTDCLGLTSVYEQLGPAQRSLLANAVQSPWLDDTKDAKEVIPSFTLRQPIVRDEKMVVSTSRMRQSAFISTAKASSVYIPPEQVYELAAGPTSPESIMARRSATTTQFKVNFPLTEIVDSLVEMIMERITSLDDLFNFVLVNKRFYRVFKNRELPIIKSALYQMSRPAWELREMSPPWTTEWQHVLDPDSQVPEYTPSLYLDRYAQDIYTLAQLKSMILMRCAPFMRRDTVRGLAGLDDQRAEEVDNAFWRIWTFCRIFGSGKGRENDLEGQVDWLRGGVKARKAQGSSSSMTEPFGINNVLFEPPEGFAHGNYSGLTPTELYDMTEIWTCLGVLVQPLHAKCIEARNVGIFNGIDVPENDPVREETVLEEWTSYVLTLGLSAVLMVSSLNPTETTAITFERANAVGLTKWELTEGQTTRSSFMKEAVSRVYDDRERYSFSLPSGSADSPCELPSNEVMTREEDSERRQVFSQEIRVQRREGRNQPCGGDSFAMERPMSTYSTILHSLGGSIGRIVHGAPSVPPVPPLTFDRSSTSTGSRSPPPPGTPNYAPGTPQHAPGTPTHPSGTPNYMLGTPGQIPTSEPKTPLLRSPPLSGSFMPAPLQPQVQDPVDRAISHMVNELGFFEDDVKWALKITDSGEGINVEAAEQLLQQQKKKADRNPFVARGRNNNGKNPLLMSVMKQQGAQESGWRWA
ncbi:hypothetical protein N7486_006139 [Penicillium sp. IBT 16267x]|nr:hypothetical protein N7486_006139 [Penicillium sp. IBT 16267x]